MIDDLNSLSGQSLGQYELRELLGKGGMGVVYRAFQAALKREVALKILPASLAEQSNYIERFNREAQTAASLEHPHIVPIYDYGTQRSTSYVVMRLLLGGSLAQRLKLRSESSDPLPSLGETNELLKQLASALDYAHSRGVIHRDIKPSNVMFDNQGLSYLVDFGIAKLMDSTSAITGTGMSMGTPSYMPPEQWRGDNLTPTADQYALAVMMYSMVTGKLPFEAPTPYALMHKHLHELPTPLHAWRRDVPEDVNRVLERAMSKEGHQRFKTVTEFAQAFEGAIAGVEGESTVFFTFHVSSEDPPTVRPSQAPVIAAAPGTAPAPIATAPITAAVPVYRNPLAWGMGVIILLLIVVLVFLVLSNMRPDDTELRETQVAQNVQTAIAANAASEREATQTQVAMLAAVSDEPTETPTNEPSSTDTEAPTATNTDEPTEAPTTADTEEPTSTDEPTEAANDNATSAALGIESDITLTVTNTRTPRPTRTPSRTPRPTSTETATNTDEPTEAPSETATNTDTPAPTEVPTETATNTDTPAPTVVALVVETDTPEPSPTSTATDEPTETDTPTLTSTATKTATDTDTPEPTAADTSTDVPTSTDEPTETDTPAASETPSPTEAQSGPTDTPDRAATSMALILGAQATLTEIAANATATPSDTPTPPLSDRDATTSALVRNAQSTLTAIAQSAGVSASSTPAADNSQIVFSSNRDGDYEIYVMDANGDNVRQLTFNASDDLEPDWSPDHSRIVFSSNVNGVYSLYVMDMATGGAVRLTTGSGGNEGQPDWSPDGSQIVFSSLQGEANDIFVVNADGTNLRRLTTNTVNDWYPDWSPDGQRIVFVTDSVNGDVFIGDIFVMNTDGSGIQTITRNDTDDLQPSWSPDGNEILFTSDRDGDFEVYVYSLIPTGLSSNLRQLTNNTVPYDVQPAWSPNGSRIVYISGESLFEIYTMDTQGGDVQQITSNSSDDIHPDW